MGILIKYLKKYQIPFIVAMICLGTESMMDLLQPTIMARIIDQGVAQKNMAYVVQMGMWMLLATGSGAIMAIIRTNIASTLSSQVGARLRLELFEKIQSFSFKDKDQFETGSLITRMTNDVTVMSNFVMGIMRIFVKAPLVCVGAIIMAIVLSKEMAMILLVMIPIVIALLALSMKIGYPYFDKAQAALDLVNSRMREYLSGVRVVKAFNRFDYEVEKFGEVNNQLATTSMKSMELMAIFLPLITLVVNMAIIAVLWLGGYRVEQGTLQVGKLIALINYMTQILIALVMISNIFMMLVRTKASAQRIEAVLIQKNDMEQPSAEAANQSMIQGGITFKNVAFSYSGIKEDHIIEAIDLEIQPGERIGIIGATGSGKTTLLQLIPRFYDITEGELLIDHVPIHHYRLEHLRNSLGIVEQKALLFTGTIEENLRMGDPIIEQETLNEMCQWTQSLDFIQGFQKGFDTLLGQGGVNLSGGQKQRLALTRALLKKPKILLLDDCTSALDVGTDRQIQSALKTHLQGVTMLWVSQRLASVMDLDRIVVIDEGRIVGIGTHQQLLNSNEIYQSIYDTQIGY